MPATTKKPAATRRKSATKSAPKSAAATKPAAKPPTKPAPKRAAKPRARPSAAATASSAASAGTAPLTEYRRKRDFKKTAEPKGAKPVPRQTLAFVIQKHAASHLHFDLRLELDGVMKSWAVPKGPSLDPSVKRLAMEVEDHPVEYNKFEGIIPAGEYGGGTVMLWDRGTYTYWKQDPDPIERLREGYAKGDFKFELKGKRLGGTWVLVRTRRGESKPQWLLIKHRDEFARPGFDIVAEEMTSVATGRTMEAIASGRSRVWANKPGR
jgi:bifunctional non-homologous end joining protein LigD